MKVAPIVEELKKLPTIQHFLVHSGQHYDESLSGSFFTDLGLPVPDVNLDVGSGSHATQTAEVMKRIAAPMIGGVVTSAILGLLLYPVLYVFWRGHRLHRR